MRKHDILKPGMLAATVLALFTNISFANVQPSVQKINIQPTTVYQAIKGKPLAEALAQVAQRSGITFKINTDLGKDIVSQTASSDSWNDAVKALLLGYNFTTIEDGNNIKTVIISGRNSDGVSAAPAQANATTAGNIITIEPKKKTLPKKYRDFPADSVTTINLPVEALLNAKSGTTIALDLPMGQFNAAHTRTVSEDDGSITWVGYLSDEGEGYRIFLSKGAAGTMGVITTPDGVYHIEADKNDVYLVDTSKLKHAGFLGDTVIPNQIIMAAVAKKAGQAQVTQLQLATDNARKALDTVNSQLTQAKALLKKHQAAYAAAGVVYDTATGKLTAAKNVYLTVTSNYKISRTSTNQAALKTAVSALNTATTAHNAAVRAYNAALNNVNNAVKAVATKTAAAAKAQVNYDVALKTLNDAKSVLVTVTTPAPPSVTSVGTASANAGTPVVDLMVVYTTAGYSADYAKQRITLLTTTSNQAYLDSGINMKLRLVYTESTSYIDTNSNSQALDDLTNDRGVFAGISQKRSQYGADLVFLFRPLYAKTAGSCGTTYLEFANGSPANKSIGYGVISDGNSLDAQRTTYCAVNTFSHEIGHSLGLVHDREYSNGTGVFSYSYAWGVQNSFATIMSYKQPILMYFSSPALASQCAGQPCGYAEADKTRSSDQARSVNYTAPIVAEFMPTKVAGAILN
ncbi:MAG: reprolysin-like metallopeptidase [Methylococcales bacterium]